MNKEENNEYYPDELTTEILDELWFDMSFTKDYIKHKYEFYKLRDSYVLLDKENKQLKERMDKAIKVIEEVLESWEKEKEYHLVFDIAELLNILKGEKNE